MRGDVIEMRSDIGEQPFARTQRLRKRLVNALVQSGKNLVENGAIERLFILEVVIEQSLVDAGSAGDGIGAGTGYTCACKLADCRLQYCGAALLRTASGAGAGFRESGRHDLFLL